MRNVSRVLGLTLSLLLFSGCTSTHNNFAPVVDLGTQYAKQKGYYTVQRGDTLYFIAWRFEMNDQKLAQINHIQAPYSLRIGQRIYLHGAQNTRKPAAMKITSIKETSLVKEATPIKKVTPVKHAAPVNAVFMKQSKITHWIWPVKGSIIQKYSASNKGINISGAEGENILASAAGQVVYAGNGLRAYGNLIIIKHNDTYLSAYAHTQDMLVKQGIWVKQGQVIAHMGDSGTNRVMLHFEIRKDGKPINPLKFLH